MDEGEAVV